MILIQILLYILLGQIQLKYGGSFSALKEEPLHDWLKKQNPRLAFTVSSLLNGHQLCYILLCHFSQNRFDAAVERFMLSCAGYCVATYVLVSLGDVAIKVT